jgi:hypothetical protein
MYKKSFITLGPDYPVGPVPNRGAHEQVLNSVVKTSPNTPAGDVDIECIVCSAVFADRDQGPML